MKAQRHNEKWSRDELILALDLYFRIKPKAPDPGIKEVAVLSKLLKRIGEIEGRNHSPNFRSLASVVMKLMNFRSLDPDYTGKGLVSIGRADKLVWDELSDNLSKLHSLASVIQETYLSLNLSVSYETSDEEALEGTILTRLHVARERNPKLVTAKKNKVFKDTGALCCEICGFDFALTYGNRGRGYIECHHIIPLHTLAPKTITKLHDLALVCSNCHRMLHRSRPWVSISQLKAELVRQISATGD